jgi:prepilin-type N-terminal cleavage/methylation domain-containing protein
MKRIGRVIKPWNKKGFTLIEVIIALVVVAILGTLMVSYYQGGIQKSGIPVIWVTQEFQIFQAMERITADYKKALSDGTSFSSFEATITTANTAGNYGTGLVMTADYINISTGGTISPSDSTNGLILRVTLQKGDQSVTSLFTK